MFKLPSTRTLLTSQVLSNTVAAFKGRTIHAFHTEGAGGSYAPTSSRYAAKPMFYHHPPTQRDPLRSIQLTSI